MLHRGMYKMLNKSSLFWFWIKTVKVFWKQVYHWDGSTSCALIETVTNEMLDIVLDFVGESTCLIPAINLMWYARKKSRATALKVTDSVNAGRDQTVSRNTLHSDRWRCESLLVQKTKTWVYRE